MKQFLIFIWVWVWFIVFTYLALSFVELSINPFTWHIASRVVLSVFGCLYVFPAGYISEKQTND